MMDKETVKQHLDEQSPPPTETAQKPPRYREILSKRYPDKIYETDQDAEDAFYEDYEQKSAALQEAEISNKEVYQLIEDNPVLADLLVIMTEGVPFEVALARCVDLEALKPIEGEANYEQYQTAVADRKKRSDEIAANRKTIEDNQTKSKVDADEFFVEKGMDEAEQVAFVSFVEDFVSALFRGEVNKTSLNKMYQAYKFEEAITDATQQGEINGRNAQIETKRMANANTDGIPTPGTAVVDSAPKPKGTDFLDDVLEKQNKKTLK